jgi:hypothetical protein
MAKASGTSSVLVIQRDRSLMATGESRVIHANILINHGRNRASSHDRRAHPLAFTNSGDAPGCPEPL